VGERSRLPPEERMIQVPRLLIRAVRHQWHVGPERIWIRVTDAGPGFEGVSEPADPFRSAYDSPGWKRVKAAQAAGSRRDPGVIEGKAQLIESGDANSVGGSSGWRPGDRVFHQKFGYGVVKITDGAKLTVAFDKAGTKKVVASFVGAAP